jgi:hypothetical protein
MQTPPRAEPKVRIHLPPAESQQTFGSSNNGGPLFDRMIPLPSSGPWDEKNLISNPPLPTIGGAIRRRSSARRRLLRRRPGGTADTRTIALFRDWLVRSVAEDTAPSTSRSGAEIAIGPLNAGPAPPVRRRQRSERRLRLDLLRADPHRHPLYHRPQGY